MMRTPRPKPVNIRAGTHGGLGGGAAHADPGEGEPRWAHPTALATPPKDVRGGPRGGWPAGPEARAVNGRGVGPPRPILWGGHPLRINGGVPPPPFRFTALGA